MSGYLRARSPSEVIKRGYSDDELANIYALGRLFLECGQLRRAEIVFRGITEVAPEFAPAWLGLGYIKMIQGQYDLALVEVSRALRRHPESPEAMLMNVICSLSTGDLNAAGTFLGELKDEIDAQKISDTFLLRLYRSQLIRFQSR
jgi:Tfp pilus assembly protein PilF